MEEYASRRLTLLWTSAATFPIVIESAAATQMNHKLAGSMGLKDNSQKNGENRSLWGGGHEANHGRRRAFVDVRCPDMKRRSGDFESQANEHQCHGGVGEDGGMSRWRA